ncbi:MAG: glycoside hydrolase family 2 protein [Solobacterium sp.]|nr:glycoside hydrolase family 2 protein [Solobacterium sp.]
MQVINNGWEYIDAWDDAFFHGKKADCVVRIPHTVKELPLHYIDHQAYQKIVGYRKKIKIAKKDKNKRVFLQLDGAAHIATVYCNGIEVDTHRNGYTAFRVELTACLNDSDENEVVVKLDTTENKEVPPFGYAIDYLTFGGIYRDVYLDIRNETYLKDVYVTTPTLTTANVLCSVDRKEGNETLEVTIETEDGFFVAKQEFKVDEWIQIEAKNITPWSLENPCLYRATVVLKRNGKVLDTIEKLFGYRTVTFDENHFYLNGKKVFLRGLNRHQSFPYIGYAATESLQREDARILDEELGVNAVRTSHYPQSHYFLDECDHRGILVFTEIPGWQHIGDEAWKQQAILNTQEMIMQYRGHPSIFLWGVRINESLDDDEFYKKTNETAYLLDATRKTSGVRYLEKSSLLEDVYSYNDFSHDGTNAGVKAKRDVTPDVHKPLLISEANGHMFPTKPYDDWAHRQAQALRHARVLNDAMADEEHAGCFQWCMFDYATHQDFGSGDRICYHGVMDSFRNPKLAASLYASQQSEVPVLEIGSSMDIGDYPAGRIDPIYAFTNADEVELYKNEDYVETFYPKEFSALPHGPICIDNFIGGLLETKEGFDKQKAALIKDCLNAAAKLGMPALPLLYKAKLGYAMLRYHMTFEDGVNLYHKYVGNWGEKAIVWKFVAKKNGEVVKEVIKTPNTELKLETVVSNQNLKEGVTYDMAAVRMRLVDGNGNPAIYAQLPLILKTKGPIEIVGPSVVTAEGGMTGTYVKTTGEAGTAELIISNEQIGTERIVFVIKGKEK